MGFLSSLANFFTDEDKIKSAIEEVQKHNKELESVEKKPLTLTLIGDGIHVLNTITY